MEVIVLAVPDAAEKPHGVSRHLLRATDDLDLLAGSVIDETVIRIEVAPKQERGTYAPKTAHEPEPAPETNGPPRPTPTPSAVAAAARRAPTAPAPALAYQGSTGEPSRVMPGYDDPAEYDDQIDAVVAKVLSAFRQSATAEEMADLIRSKPSVPRDLDRALLVDLSDTLDMYDLTDPIRHRLRERFWLQCV